MTTIQASTMMTIQANTDFIPAWLREPQRFEGARAPKNSRKLIYSGQTYRFRVGKKHTQVWTPDGIKYVIDANGLLGFDVFSYHESKYEITPYHIKAFIERGFGAARKPVC